MAGDTQSSFTEVMCRSSSPVRKLTFSRQFQLATQDPPMTCPPLRADGRLPEESMYCHTNGHNGAPVNSVAQRLGSKGPNQEFSKQTNKSISRGVLNVNTPGFNHVGNS